MKKEIKKIEEFLLIVEHTKIPHYIQPYVSYQIMETKENNIQAITILDEEGDKIFVVKSFDEFIAWFIKNALIRAFKSGQESIKRAAKEILGITI